MTPDDFLISRKGEWRIYRFYKELRTQWASHPAVRRFADSHGVSERVWCDLIVVGEFGDLSEEVRSRFFEKAKIES